MVIPIKETAEIIIVNILQKNYSINDMKANFNIKKNKKIKKHKTSEELTEEEFEDFVSKSGAAGTFMVFRSKSKKEDEMGIDELQNN